MFYINYVLNHVCRITSESLIVPLQQVSDHRWRGTKWAAYRPNFELLKQKLLQPHVELVICVPSTGITVHLHFMTRICHWPLNLHIQAEWTMDGEWMSCHIGWISPSRNYGWIPPTEITVHMYFMIRICHWCLKFTSSMQTNYVLNHVCQITCDELSSSSAPSVRS